MHVNACRRRPFTKQMNQINASQMSENISRISAMRLNSNGWLWSLEPHKLDEPDQPNKPNEPNKPDKLDKPNKPNKP